MITSKRRSGWLIAVIISLFILLLAACQPAQNTPSSTSQPTAASTQSTGGLDLSTPGATATPAATPTLYVLEGAKTTASGLQYMEETLGSGAAPRAGDLITMHYVASLPDGTELFNTYTANQPVTTVWGQDRLLPGWEEGVGLMKAGGKAQFVLPANLALGEQGSGSVPPNSQLVISIELLSVEAAPLPSEVAEDQLVRTSSGLQYYDLATGEGAEAATNFSVKTSYTIWVKTEDGYKFIEQSPAEAPVNFILGRGDTVFPGWEEGASGMKVGGKRLLVVPPELGLGAQSSGLIPPNSTLVMEIELLDAKEPRAATPVDEKDYTTTESGLKYYDLTTGTGASPQAGQNVVVHYTGWLTDGTQFDSSIDRGEPFSFVLGAGNVIPGWEEGVATMQVGGKRQLVIPSSLGYGDQGAGSLIPPGATLIFEIELLEIQ